MTDAKRGSVRELSGRGAPLPAGPTRWREGVKMEVGLVNDHSQRGEGTKEAKNARKKTGTPKPEIKGNRTRHWSTPRQLPYVRALGH